jgi:hypothetical protein
MASAMAFWRLFKLRRALLVQVYNPYNLLRLDHLFLSLPVQA